MNEKQSMYVVTEETNNAVRKNSPYILSDHLLCIIREVKVDKIRKKCHPYRLSQNDILCTKKNEWLNAENYQRQAEKALQRVGFIVDNWLGIMTSYLVRLENTVRNSVPNKITWFHLDFFFVFLLYMILRIMP